MIEFDPILVHDWLRYSAKRLPDKPALVADNRRMSYSALNETSDKVAQALMSIGIRRHDRVVVFLGHHPVGLDVDGGGALFSSPNWCNRQQEGGCEKQQEVYHGESGR